MLKKIRLTIDRSFDAGNRENFILNEILLVISVFLLFIAGLYLLQDLRLIIISDELIHILHISELVFGILFLVEFLLRTWYVYIPDKNFIKPYTFMQILVIISLLMPSLFNLAFLRIIWIIKMFKVYHFRHEDKKLIATNPALTIKK